jgi:cell division protein FtsB
MADTLDSLKAKLAASERMGVGYAARVEAIKREIEKLSNG